VPAFLQGQGFAQDAAGAGLQAACSEALLAVLATPPVAEHQDYAAGGALQSATAVHSVTELTERLLELGAAVHHVRQQDGMTPLVAALAAGQLEAAGMLLDAGAHADPPAHTTALAIAAAAAGPSAGPVNNKRRRREAATAGGSAEVAPSIGQQASSVTVQPTPLVLAVAADSAQLVSRLLAAGADVNRQCTMQLAGSQVGSQVALTPLIAAVNLGSAPLVHQLLEAGADLHQKCIAPGSSGVEFTR
jgi:ankyrin repeat protein